VILFKRSWERDLIMKEKRRRKNHEQKSPLKLSGVCTGGLKERSGGRRMSAPRGFVMGKGGLI